MKETAKIQLEILNTKRGNIVKNIDNINEKIQSLQNQLEKEHKALARIDSTIANFGKKKAKEENSTAETPGSPTEDSVGTETLSE